MQNPRRTKHIYFKTKSKVNYFHFTYVICPQVFSFYDFGMEMPFQYITFWDMLTEMHKLKYYYLSPVIKYEWVLPWTG